jgi:signal transduction histidine kinase
MNHLRFKINQILISQILIIAIGNYLLTSVVLSFSSINLGSLPIWPAIGFIQAMVLLFGFRCWPGIILGTIPALLTRDFNSEVIIQIAIGDTLAVLIPYAFLNKSFSFEKNISGIRSYSLYLFFMGLLGPALGASFGVFGLYFWGKLPAALIGSTWFNWFFSNFLGSMVIGIGVLVWWGRPWNFKLKVSELIHVIALCLITIFIGFVAFLDIFNLGVSRYFTFVPLVWSAVSFGQRGVAFIVLFFTCFSIWAVASETSSSLIVLGVNKLLYLQILLGVLSLTGGLLASFVEERNKLIKQRDDFISIAAHELRTPLASLKMQLNLLGKFLTGVDFTKKEKLLPLLENSQNQLERFSALVEDLLDINRLRSHRIVLNKSEVNLNRLIDFVIKRYEFELTKAQCSLKLSLEPVTGFWDEVRLEQVLVNLLNNAIKFGAGKSIELETRHHGNNVTIKVTDHGIGIAKNDQTRVFDPYERAVSFKSFSGVGLGLFITREIVKAHHGNIKVESELGEGASFQIQLPRWEMS